MKMRTVILLLFLVAAGGVIFWLFGMGGLKRMRADQITSRIEAYRQREGRLPDPADDPLMKRLGFELRMGWHPEYQRMDDMNYRIVILEGFDGPYWIYESKTGKWRRGFPRVGR